MRANHFQNIGKPVPRTIIEQLRLKESKEYREALARSGKRKLEILWAGIKHHGNDINACEVAFVYS